MPSAHYDVIRRGGIGFAPDVFGSGTEHSDWHEWCGAQHPVGGSQRVSASAALVDEPQRVGTTPRRATQLPTAWPSGCIMAKAESTWAGPHRCGWRRD
jgi:hypothetical protein